MKSSMTLILSTMLLFSCGKSKSNNSSAVRQQEGITTDNDPSYNRVLPFHPENLSSVGLTFAGQEPRINMKSNLAMICEDTGATNSQRLVRLKKYFLNVIKLHQSRDTAWYMGGCSLSQPGPCRLYHPSEVETILQKAINNLEKSVQESAYCPSWTIAYAWTDTRTNTAIISDIYKHYYPSDNYKTNYCLKKDGLDSAVMVGIDNNDQKKNIYFSQFTNEETCIDSLYWIIDPGQNQHYTSETITTYECYRDLKNIFDYILIDELKEKSTERILELRVVNKHQNKESCMDARNRM